jgi:hypothetical protein
LVDVDDLICSEEEKTAYRGGERDDFESVVGETLNRKNCGGGSLLEVQRYCEERNCVFAMVEEPSVGSSSRV